MYWFNCPLMYAHVKLRNTVSLYYILYVQSEKRNTNVTGGILALNKHLNKYFTPWQFHNIIAIIQVTNVGCFSNPFLLNAKIM